jgi:Protein of unknown function (DUF3341)
MREPAATTPVFGLMAEFDRPERLLDAVKRTRGARYRTLDAYTPFPIEGLAEALGFKDRRVPILTLIGGIGGAAIGFGMQVYTNLSFPIDIGNRPLVAVPAFMLITFELAVLGAVLLGIGGMLALNRLPRLHHPVFDVESFHLASSDKFFLVIFSTDKKFDADGTRAFLSSLKPRRIDIMAQQSGAA